MIEENFEALKQEYEKKKVSDDRELVIDEILQSYVRQAQVQSKNATEKKVSFFIGGGSNAGKSTYRKNLMKNQSDNVLLIDSDHLKTLIPEYSELVRLNPSVAAKIVHEESSLMASKLFKRAVEDSLLHLFDATLKNTEKYKGFFSLLKEAGFEINLVIIDVSIETALQRNRIRYEEALEKGEFPRLVPDDIVVTSHKQIAKSFDVLKDFVDNCVIINTENSDDEVIAAFSRVDDIIQPIIYNEGKYRDFMSKNNI